MGGWGAGLVPVVLLASLTGATAFSKNFVNSSLPDSKFTFVVNFDFSQVICQHSENKSDLHVHEMSILCDGKQDCFTNPAMHDESFPYCEKKCDSTCNNRGACLYDGVRPQCYCNSGFSGPSCEFIDKNECLDRPCHLMADCLNTPTGYSCVCRPGFHGDGYKCSDIDECTTPYLCPEHSTCVNLPGTHYCNCTEGFTQKGDSLLTKCVDINECEVGSHKCGKNQLCENTIGGYTCVSGCTEGYEYVNGECLDIDECKREDICNPRAECFNSPGSYSCICEDGMTGDGQKCEPITDCTQREDICHRHAQCIYPFKMCQCVAGFVGDGITCHDINECEAAAEPCKNQKGTRCVNIVGGHICCKEGDDDSRCIEEQGVFCAGGCGLNAYCGNKTCECLPGYSGDPLRKCLDVNECDADGLCPGVGQWCVNVFGSYLCCGPNSKEPECQGVHIFRSSDGTTAVLHTNQTKDVVVSEEQGEHGVTHSGGVVAIGKGVLYKNGSLPSISVLSKRACTSYCPINSECVNGYCECSKGFGGNPHLGCEDINECLIGSPCGEQTDDNWCVNTEGSFVCCTRNSTENDCIGLEIVAGPEGGLRFVGNRDGETIITSINETDKKVVFSQSVHEFQNASQGGAILLVKQKSKVPTDITILKPDSGEMGLEIVADGKERDILPKAESTAQPSASTVTLPGIISTLGGLSSTTTSIPVTEIPIHTSEEKASTSPKVNGTSATTILIVPSTLSPLVEVEGSGSEAPRSTTTPIEDGDMLQSGQTTTKVVPTPDGHINVRFTTIDEINKNLNETKTTASPKTVIDGDETGEESTVDGKAGKKKAEGHINVIDGDGTGDVNVVDTFVGTTKAPTPEEKKNEANPDNEGLEIIAQPKKPITDVTTAKPGEQSSLSTRTTLSEGGIKLTTSVLPESTETTPKPTGTSALKPSESAQPETTSITPEQPSTSATSAEPKGSSSSGESTTVTNSEDKTSITPSPIAKGTTGKEKPIESSTKASSAEKDSTNPDTKTTLTNSIGGTETSTVSIEINHESGKEGQDKPDLAEDSREINGEDKNEKARTTNKPTTSKTVISDREEPGKGRLKQLTETSSAEQKAPEKDVHGGDSGDSIEGESGLIGEKTTEPTTGETGLEIIWRGSSTTTARPTESSTDVDRSGSVIGSSGSVSSGSSGSILATSGKNEGGKPGQIDIIDGEKTEALEGESRIGAKTSTEPTTAETGLEIVFGGSSTTQAGVTPKESTDAPGSTGVTDAPTTTSPTAKVPETESTLLGNTSSPSSASTLEPTGSSSPVTAQPVEPSREPEGTTREGQIHVSIGPTSEPKGTTESTTAETGLEIVHVPTEQPKTTEEQRTQPENGESTTVSSTEVTTAETGLEIVGVTPTGTTGGVTESTKSATTQPPATKETGLEIVPDGTPTTKATTQQPDLVLTGATKTTEGATTVSSTTSVEQSSTTSTVSPVTPTLTSGSPEGLSSTTPLTETEATTKVSSPVTAAGKIEEPTTTTTAAESTTEKPTDASTASSSSKAPKTSSITSEKHTLPTTVTEATTERTTAVPSVTTEQPDLVLSVGTHTTSASTQGTTSLGTSAEPTTTQEKLEKTTRTPGTEVEVVTTEPDDDLTVAPTKQSRFNPEEAPTRHKTTKETFSLLEKSTPTPATLGPNNITKCVSSDECGDDALCERRTGACRCLPGFQGVPPSTPCTDVDECAEGLHKCHESARCHNIVGTYACFCPMGYRKNELGQCVDIDECAESRGNCCSVNGTCVNKEGSYGCQCKPGFFGDGYKCMPVEKRSCTEAELAKAGCGQHHVCGVDGVGHVDCNTCKMGFKMVDGKCTDINECSESGLNMCSPSANCNNLLGTYACSCKEGFKGDGYMCEDIDECTANPCHPQAECENLLGSFKCSCPSGFTGDGIKECMNPLERSCENVAGFCGRVEHTACLSVRIFNGSLSSVCECEPGFRFNKELNKCEDINECEENRHNCDPASSVCVNENGGFHCDCAEGYEGVGGVCVDVNECERGTAGCHSMAMCLNQPGSCGCKCMQGFTGDGIQCNPLQKREEDNACTAEWDRLCLLENKTCHVDEEDVPQCGSCIEGHHPINGSCQPVHGAGTCADPNKNTCDKNAECIDIPGTPGKHFCTCKKGFIGDGLRCDDIDECSLTGICHLHATCKNLPGSFSCTCNTGYTGNGFTCTKIAGPNCHLNEELCHKDAECTMDGQCKCKKGFEGDGFKECTEAASTTASSPKTEDETTTTATGKRVTTPEAVGSTVSVKETARTEAPDTNGSTTEQPDLVITGSSTTSMSTTQRGSVIVEERPEEVELVTGSIKVSIPTTHSTQFTEGPKPPSTTQVPLTTKTAGSTALVSSTITRNVSSVSSIISPDNVTETTKLTESSAEQPGSNSTVKINMITTGETTDRPMATRAPLTDFELVERTTVGSTVTRLVAKQDIETTLKSESTKTTVRSPENRMETSNKKDKTTTVQSRTNETTTATEKPTTTISVEKNSTAKVIPEAEKTEATTIGSSMRTTIPEGEETESTMWIEPTKTTIPEAEGTQSTTVREQTTSPKIDVRTKESTLSSVTPTTFIATESATWTEELLTGSETGRTETTVTVPSTSTGPNLLVNTEGITIEGSGSESTNLPLDAQSSTGEKSTATKSLLLSTSTTSAPSTVTGSTLSSSTNRIEETTKRTTSVSKATVTQKTSRTTSLGVTEEATSTSSTINLTEASTIEASSSAKESITLSSTTFEKIESTTSDSSNLSSQPTEESTKSNEKTSQATPNGESSTTIVTTSTLVTVPTTKVESIKEAPISGTTLEGNGIEPSTASSVIVPSVNTRPSQTTGNPSATSTPTSTFVTASTSSSSQPVTQDREIPMTETPTMEIIWSEEMATTQGTDGFTSEKTVSTTSEAITSSKKTTTVVNLHFTTSESSGEALNTTQEQSNESITIPFTTVTQSTLHEVGKAATEPKTSEPTTAEPTTEGSGLDEVNRTIQPSTVTTKVMSTATIATTNASTTKELEFSTQSSTKETKTSGTPSIQTTFSTISIPSTTTRNGLVAESSSTLSTIETPEVATTESEDFTTKKVNETKESPTTTENVVIESTVSSATTKKLRGTTTSMESSTLRSETIATETSTFALTESTTIESLQSTITTTTERVATSGSPKTSHERETFPESSLPSTTTENNLPSKNFTSPSTVLLSTAETTKISSTKAFTVGISTHTGTKSTESTTQSTTTIPETATRIEIITTETVPSSTSEEPSIISSPEPKLNVTTSDSLKTSVDEETTQKTATKALVDSELTTASPSTVPSSKATISTELIIKTTKTVSKEPGTSSQPDVSSTVPSTTAQSEQKITVPLKVELEPDLSISTTPKPQTTKSTKTSISTLTSSSTLPVGTDGEHDFNIITTTPGAEVATQTPSSLATASSITTDQTTLSSSLSSTSGTTFTSTSLPESATLNTTTNEVTVEKVTSGLTRLTTSGLFEEATSSVPLVVTPSSALTDQPSSILFVPSTQPTVSTPLFSSNGNTALNFTVSPDSSDSSSAAPPSMTPISFETTELAPTTEPELYGSTQESTIQTSTTTSKPRTTTTTGENSTKTEDEISSSTLAPDIFALNTSQAPLHSKMASFIQSTTRKEDFMGLEIMIPREEEKTTSMEDITGIQTEETGFTSHPIKLTTNMEDVMGLEIMNPSKGDRTPESTTQSDTKEASTIMEDIMGLEIMNPKDDKNTVKTTESSTEEPKATPEATESSTEESETTPGKKTESSTEESRITPEAMDVSTEESKVTSKTTTEISTEESETTTGKKTESSTEESRITPEAMDVSTEESKVTSRTTTEISTEKSETTTGKKTESSTRESKTTSKTTTEIDTEESKTTPRMTESSTEESRITPEAMDVSTEEPKTTSGTTIDEQNVKAKYKSTTTSTIRTTSGNLENTTLPTNRAHSSTFLNVVTITTKSSAEVEALPDTTTLQSLETLKSTTVLPFTEIETTSSDQFFSTETTSLEPDQKTTITTTTTKVSATASLKKETTLENEPEKSNETMKNSLQEGDLESPLTSNEIWSEELETTTDFPPLDEITTMEDLISKDLEILSTTIRQNIPSVTQTTPSGQAVVMGHTSSKIPVSTSTTATTIIASSSTLTLRAQTASDIVPSSTQASVSLETTAESKSTQDDKHGLETTTSQIKFMTINGSRNSGTSSTQATELSSTESNGSGEKSMTLSGFTRGNVETDETSSETSKTAKAHFLQSTEVTHYMEDSTTYATSNLWETKEDKTTTAEGSEDLNNKMRTTPTLKEKPTTKQNILLNKDFEMTTTSTVASSSEKATVEPSTTKSATMTSENTLVPLGRHTEEPNTTKMYGSSGKGSNAMELLFTATMPNESVFTSPTIQIDPDDINFKEKDDQDEARKPTTVTTKSSSIVIQLKQSSPLTKQTHQAGSTIEPTSPDHKDITTITPKEYSEITSKPFTTTIVNPKMNGKIEPKNGNKEEVENLTTAKVETTTVVGLEELSRVSSDTATKQPKGSVEPGNSGTTMPTAHSSPESQNPTVPDEATMVTATQNEHRKVSVITTTKSSAETDTNRRNGTTLQPSITDSFSLSNTPLATGNPTVQRENIQFTTESVPQRNVTLLKKESTKVSSLKSNTATSVAPTTVIRPKTTEAEVEVFTETISHIKTTERPTLDRLLSSKSIPSTSVPSDRRSSEMTTKEKPSLAPSILIAHKDKFETNTNAPSTSPQSTTNKTHSKVTWKVVTPTTKGKTPFPLERITTLSNLPSTSTVAPPNTFSHSPEIIDSNGAYFPAPSIVTESDVEVNTSNGNKPANPQRQELGRCSVEDRSKCHEFAICDLSTSSCRCKDGFEGDGYSNCRQVISTDCVSNSSRCHSDAFCDRHTRKCACNNGYIGDGIFCSPDPQDCILRKDLCSTDAICSGRRCHCIEGFTGDGVKCVSLHQRSANCSECDVNAYCNQGVCSCNIGYFGNGLCCVPDPRDCVHFPGVCHPEASCNKQTRQCSCKKGYLGDGISCFAAVSCVTDPTVCDKNAICLPSGHCMCRNGFEGNGHSCSHLSSAGIAAIREAARDTPSLCGNKCNRESELCIEGQCICKHGYRKVNDICEDIDECANSPCHQLASCHNTRGSFGCTCPEGYVGDGITCLQHLKIGDLGVFCENDGMTLILSNDTQMFEGKMYVRGQAENPNCIKNFSPLQQHSRPYTFKVFFEHCNVQLLENNTFATTVIVQKHPHFITTTADSYDLKCTYNPGVTQVQSHVNVSELSATSTLSNQFDGPTCSLKITDDHDDFVESAKVGQSMVLRLEVSPNGTYGILPRDCVAVNIETGERYQLTDKHGCAVDDQLFPEFTQVHSSATQAVFRTFKWPDSSMIRFQCDCNACVGPCPVPDCKSLYKRTLPRFRRAHHGTTDETQIDQELETINNNVVETKRKAFSRLLTVHEDVQEQMAQEEVEQWNRGRSHLSQSLPSVSELENEGVCVRTAVLAGAALLLVLSLGFLTSAALRSRSAPTKSPDSPISVISL